MSGQAGRDSGSGERISLWRLERMLRGELPADEARAAREEAMATEEGRRFLEKYEGLAAPPTLERLRAARPPRTRSALPAGLADLFRRARGPRFAMAVVLLLGAGLWTLRPNPSPASGFRNKGGGEAEFRLRHQGQDINPGDLAEARSGDTLTVLYRSPGPMHGHLVLREEGGDPVHLGAFPLEAAAGWKPSPRRILLEGDWSRQQVWVIASPRPIEPGAALRAVREGTLEGAGIAEFRLSRER